MSSRNSGINNEIRGMGEEQNAKRQTQNDSSGISEGIDSGKQEVKLSLEDSIKTKYGEGFSVDGIDTKNYNLIDVQDKEQFNNLLNNLII